MYHEEYMARALTLAKKGRGYTSPNPMVGAVIVKNGRIIGEGYHPRPGEKHAEVMAIENASESIEGAEMYCNLEPCSHDTPEKRTPPCTLRVIRENIKKVHIATIDPNPHVSGHGINVLQSAGIPVETGLMAEEAMHLNEAYFKYIQTGLPFVHLKMAISLDGRIATSSSDSKWISDSAARKIVHELRHRYDAVLVGFNTVKADNPQLTVRLVDGRHPYRIVLDKNLSIPAHYSLVSDEFAEKTIIFTLPTADKGKKARLESRGVVVEEVQGDHNGHLDLTAVLKALGRRGITSLVVEGGGRVFTEFINQQLFDKVSMFFAPIIIGRGIEAVGDLGVTSIADAIRLQNTNYQTINDQIWVQGYRNLHETFGILTREDACLQD